jgi:hypothetical protein
MSALIDPHLPENGAAACILIRQTFEMAIQVVDDLILGFCHEAQAPLVSRDARNCANGEGAGVE